MRKFLALTFTVLFTTLFLFPGTPTSAYHSPDRKVLVIGETTLPLNFQGCLTTDAVHELTSILAGGFESAFGQTWRIYIHLGACKAFAHTAIIPLEVVFNADASGKSPHSLKFVLVRSEGDGREYYMLTNWPVERPQAAETLAPAH